MRFRSRVPWRPAPIFAWLALLAIARVTAAQDAAHGLLAAPTSYTDVADAFEEGNPVDVNVRLAYRHEVASGTIKQEVVDASSQDGRSSQHEVAIADHVKVQNELALRLEAGIYHDLMLFIRVPIVLSDDNQLRSVAASSSSSPPLFDLSGPLTSARRSGLPSLEFGVAWAVINQYRMPHLATWVLIAEAALDTGRRRQPCLEGQGCEPGVSRGTARMTLESRWSYRYRYVEPYFGVKHTFEWAQASDDQFQPPGLAGVVDAGLPSTSGAVLGAAIIPWEDRARWQRFEIDVRGTAALTTAGRDYSPLFDALGTSKNPYLASKVVAGAVSAPSVRFTGITNVEAHAQLGLETQVVMRAARYVRFALGGGFAYLTSHRITGAPACDTSVNPSTGDPSATGCDAGVVNPVYRPAIDAPGQRFRLDGELALQLQLAATAQF